MYWPGFLDGNMLPFSSKAPDLGCYFFFQTFYTVSSPTFLIQCQNQTCSYYTHRAPTTEALKHLVLLVMLLTAGSSSALLSYITYIIINSVLSSFHQSFQMWSQPETRAYPISYLLGFYSPEHQGLQMQDYLAVWTKGCSLFLGFSH